MKGRMRVVTRGIVMAMIGVFVAGSAAAQGRQAASPVPDGFVKYMVFMMNGVFDPNVPSADTAEFYQKSIRGRDDLAIEEHRAEAAAYFFDESGIDFRSSDFDSGVEFSGFHG